MVRDILKGVAAGKSMCKRVQWEEEFYEKNIDVFSFK